MKHYLTRILNYLQSIKKLLFTQCESSLQENITTETSNPYVAARHEWNFMYGDIVKAKHNWQQIAYLLGLISAALVIGLTTVSLQARFIPYAVKVDNIGNADFAGFLTKQAEVSPQMINAMLRRFITESRSVIADPVAQKHQLDFTYQESLGEARIVLDNFYRTENPFDRVKNETVDVNINSVLPKSNNTWQIHWTEINRDSTGHVSSQNHYEGLVTIEHQAPTNADDINTNPLGLYVTHLSWASQQ
jgi:type IV secretory pathway TrbF-like protein